MKLGRQAEQPAHIPQTGRKDIALQVKEEVNEVESG